MKKVTSIYRDFVYLKDDGTVGILEKGKEVEVSSSEYRRIESIANSKELKADKVAKEEKAQASVGMPLQEEKKKEKVRKV